MTHAGDQIIAMNRVYRAITGNDAHLYTSRPGDGQVRVVFTTGTVQGEGHGVTQMRAMLAEARLDWRTDAGQLDKEATDYVDMWINNDGDYYEAACELAATSIEDLANFLMDTLRDAPEGSAAWHTMRELSANDLQRIEWPEIAMSLIGE